VAQRPNGCTLLTDGEVYSEDSGGEDAGGGKFVDKRYRTAKNTMFHWTNSERLRDAYCLIYELRQPGTWRKVQHWTVGGSYEKTTENDR